MSNVKAGDLCLIVGMQVTPEANGRFVTAVKRINDGYTFSDGTRLQFLPQTRAAWLVVGHRIPIRDYGGQLRFANERGADEMCLRPITPPAGTISDSEVTELFKSDTAPMVTKEAA